MNSSTSRRRALILVDLQNDFIREGALAVPAGEEVIPIANRLIPHFEVVVATQDWHPANHQSFAANQAGLTVGECFQLHGLPQIAWPVHCVQGTEGANFAAELNVDALHHIVRKGDAPEIDSYSGFFDNGGRRATGLERSLREANVSDVYIMGLATDYCVKYTALDAVRLGFKTHLIEDGCRGVDLQPGDSQRAIEAMRAAGASITSQNRWP